MDQVKLRSFLRSLPSASVLLDREFHIVEMSDEYQRVGLIQLDAVIGKSIFDVLPENPNDPSADGVRKLGESLTRALSTQKPDSMPLQKYDIPNSEADASFEEPWWETTNTPVIDEDGRFGGDGMQALEKALRSRHDLVLVNIQMPLLDGYQVLSALQDKV